MKPLSLNSTSLVAFLGSMNAMPMAYAQHLKQQGIRVLYHVDAPKRDWLSRPEHHFPEVQYPYPDWIVETWLPTQLFLALFPKFFARFFEWRLHKKAGQKPTVYILNGFFTSLAPYLKSGPCFALSHGSDLDGWADCENVADIVQRSTHLSFFKYLPKWISKCLITRIVHNQYAGFKQSKAVIYFPKGFNPIADVLLEKLKAEGVPHIPRYDISFEPLKNEPRAFRPPQKPLEIFSGVRFLFGTFAYGDSGCSLGNDHIIQGLALYHKRNPNIRIHFVEKGGDVPYAKELCAQLGLDKVVVWYPIMPFKSLLALYNQSDICFDQLGEHWMGAIGGYALWLGKPLIANIERALSTKIWPEDHPVCQAKTPEAVYEWLVKLEDLSFFERISNDSKTFAEHYLTVTPVLNTLFAIETPS